MLELDMFSGFLRGLILLLLDMILQLLMKLEVMTIQMGECGDMMRLILLEKMGSLVI